jgi:hypothetical protein
MIQQKLGNINCQTSNLSIGGEIGYHARWLARLGGVGYNAASNLESLGEMCAIT